ncbi:MAG: hypothetical protein HY332_14135 [Chloroflexi bacterium]|nr:hypothetical protein [Chloroflexota bacterium]
MYWLSFEGHVSYRREQLLKEAEQERLYRLARSQRPSSSLMPIRRVIGWMGVRLVRWGEALQALAAPVESATPAVAPAPYHTYTLFDTRLDARLWGSPARAHLVDTVSTRVSHN